MNATERIPLDGSLHIWAFRESKILHDKWTTTTTTSYIESIFFKYVLLRIMKTENPHSQFFQIIFLSSQPTHKMHIWVKCKRLYLSFKIYISEIIFLPFILFLTITSGVKGIWGRQAPMCNGEIICWANGERVVCSMVGFQLGGLSTYLYILIHSSYPHLYNSIFYMR